MPSRFDQRKIDVQPIIVSGLQIVDRVNSATKRTASNVEEPVAWLQAPRAEELELQPADFFPHPSHHVAMSSGVDLFLSQLPIIPINLAHTGNVRSAGCWSSDLAMPEIPLECGLPE